MKELVKDITFADDLEIIGGDFGVTESDDQHIEHIMRGDRGQWRQFPLVGVGLQKQYNASVDRQKLKQEIKLQLRADGFRVKRVTVSSGDNMTINVNAKRVR